MSCFLHFLASLHALQKNMVPYVSMEWLGDMTSFCLVRYITHMYAACMFGYMSPCFIQPVLSNKAACPHKPCNSIIGTWSFLIYTSVHHIPISGMQCCSLLDMLWKRLCMYCVYNVTQYASSKHTRLVESRDALAYVSTLCEPPSKAHKERAMWRLAVSWWPLLCLGVA